MCEYQACSQQLDTVCKVREIDAVIINSIGSYTIYNSIYLLLSVIVSRAQRQSRYKYIRLHRRPNQCAPYRIQVTAITVYKSPVVSVVNLFLKKHSGARGKKINRGKVSTIVTMNLNVANKRKVISCF